MSDELSTGGAPDFPANWGFPSSIYNYCTNEYVTGGMIWYGPEKCTLEDVLAIMDDPRSSKVIDRLTLCGTDDPKWTTQRDVLLATNPGGCYVQTVTIG
jgi:hypothetical protein